MALGTADGDGSRYSEGLLEGEAPSSKKTPMRCSSNALPLSMPLRLFPGVKTASNAAESPRKVESDRLDGPAVPNTCANLVSAQRPCWPVAHTSRSANRALCLVSPGVVAVDAQIEELCAECRRL